MLNMKNIKKYGFLTQISARLFHGVARNGKRNRNMIFFAYEGVLFSLINAFINNNNNLFATRLGANDFELTLVMALPQIVGMLVLLPGSIFTDRMLNKRKMVIWSLAALGAVYFVIGFVPVLGRYSLMAFLILLAVSMGPMTMYNASWQAYFSDVVPIKERNRTFTLRTKWTFFISIAAPLFSGLLLTYFTANSSKILIHQSFFWLSCAFIILQIFILRKISGGNAVVHNAISFKDLKVAAVDLVHNRGFVGFLAVVMYFYLTWHVDWTLFYIGQVKYLKLNEAWLSYVNVGIAAVQFLTIGFWSRVNEKLGIRFSIIMGSLALCIYPLIMITGTSLPAHIAPLVFLILCTLAGFAFATVNLNIMQCLLQVIPEKNKTLSISIYTLLVSLSSAVMPVAGVKIYTLLGADLKALQTTFLIVFSFRIVAVGLWTLRWWMLREETK